MFTIVALIQEEFLGRIVGILFNSSELLSKLFALAQTLTFPGHLYESICLSQSAL